MAQACVAATVCLLQPVLVVVYDLPKISDIVINTESKLKEVRMKFDKECRNLVAVADGNCVARSYSQYSSFAFNSPAN